MPDPILTAAEMREECARVAEREYRRDDIAEEIRALPVGEERLLARNQPCGCVVCICGTEDRCLGCGSKACGTHPVCAIPNPIYDPPAPPDPRDEVVRAAREWWIARVEALRLKALRDGHRCEEAAPSEPDVGWQGTPPCWKSSEWTATKEPAYEASWCHPCIERQKVYVEFLAAKKRRGAALRSLVYRLGKDAALARLPREEGK